MRSCYFCHLYLSVQLPAIYLFSHLSNYQYSGNFLNFFLKKNVALMIIWGQVRLSWGKKSPARIVSQWPINRFDLKSHTYKIVVFFSLFLIHIKIIAFLKKNPQKFDNIYNRKRYHFFSVRFVAAIPCFLWVFHIWT